MKKKQRNKNSSLISVHNKTLEKVVIVNSNSSYGKFYTHPISIPPKQTLIFFHIKASGIMCGSKGKVIFQEKKSEIKHTIWWNSPYSGKNTCSSNGIIIQNEESPILCFIIESYNYLNN